MQMVILFPTSSSFFLYVGFLVRLRHGATDGAAGHDRGGGGSKRS
jgi:hypothetical protein